MNKLLLRFFKRFVIVPISFAIIAIIATSFVVPKLITGSYSVNNVSVEDIDISNYKLNEYEHFSQLEKGDYVATIISDEIKLSCAVCYDSTSQINSAGLSKKSKEPWSNGSVAIVGDNVPNKFKYLHNSKIGTEIKIDYYKNAICTYKITGVSYNHTTDEIKSALKKTDLLLCVPYTDFENPTESKLYTFYTAELGGVEQWK